MFGKIILPGSGRKVNIFQRNKQEERSGNANRGQESVENKSGSGNMHKNAGKIDGLNKDKKIKKERKKQDFHKKYEELQGAKFRILNQILYTRDSSDSKKHFVQNKEDFELYHEGYRYQTTKWKYRPVDEIIQFILKHKESYLNKKIVDLGCGQGFLYEELIAQGFSEKKIRSYDLVSMKPFIKEADIANLPLKAQTMDVCVFCLSLMGTNYLSFLREAWRVLKIQGELIISQVQSRSPDWKKFIEMVQMIGFKLVNDGLTLLRGFSGKSIEGRFFRSMLFRKQQFVSSKSQIRYENAVYPIQQFSELILQSCRYKRR